MSSIRTLLGSLQVYDSHVFIQVRWSRALHSHTCFTGHQGTFLFLVIILLLLQTFQKTATSVRFFFFFSLNYYNPQVLFVVLASLSKLPEQSDFRARRIIVQTALFLTECRFIPLLNSTEKIRREWCANPPLSELSPFPTFLWRRRSGYWQPHSSVHQQNPQHEASNEINAVF